MLQKDALDNLLYAQSALATGLGVRFWLDAGTLLGAHREHDFIGHDTDLDIGVYAEQLPTWEDVADLIEQMRLHEFTLYHTLGQPNYCFEMAFKRKNIKLDIFWYYQEAGRRKTHMQKNGGRNGKSDLITLDFTVDVINELHNINFLGHEFPVPLRTEDYLIMRYGDDWKIPNKRWNWATGPRNIISNE